ncbi:MAG: acetate--CoA ligase family protein, partial [Candidatus Aminicenantes bacterium]|nr:acetate--CoA ligase family protein [Candidatus Aminicenantes bacterium]
MNIHLDRVNKILAGAEKDGRSFLLEHEVYAMLKAAGLGVPRFFLLEKGKKAKTQELAALGTTSVVLKVVSPLIQHKSDAGGVRFVKADAAAVNRAVEEMLAAVPATFRTWAGKFKKPGEKGGPARKDVEASIRGVLVCEKVAYDNVGFGSEILAGVKDSREFGPVMTIGAGGLDVEYMNERIREGKAVSLLSVHLFDEGRFRTLLEPLAFFGKVAKAFRGRKPLITPESLAGSILRFVKLARALSAYAGDSPYVIEEFEVNPLVIRKGKLVPLDGLCRFSRAHRELTARPYGQIRNLLRPDSIGIIGVSEKMNIGHIILNNILKNGFPKERVFVVKPGAAEIEGCRSVPTVRDLPGTVDMFVLTLGAEQSYDVMKEITENGKARSVIIIAGGLGEKRGTQGLEGIIKDLIARGREEGRTTPVVNGGNCLGIVSKPGKYDTTFITDHKLPRPKGSRSDMAVISQSGAFMISRMSKMPHIEPRYAVSLGNQIDLTASDYLNYLKDEPEVRTFAVYMEGFRPGDGYAFARAVEEITARGRTVVVYKSGRSPEGRGAASSHTASVAGDYNICRSILKQAGAIVCEDIEEYENFVRSVHGLEGRKVRGNRVGLVSNAGFECVIMADSLKDDEAELVLAEFAPATWARIVEALKPLGIDKL